MPRSPSRHRASGFRFGAACFFAFVSAALLAFALLSSPQPVSAPFAGTGLRRAWAADALPLPGGTVAVNSADLWELTELPGVGETLARAIIDERERNGFFFMPEDLLCVKGIGVKKLLQFRDMLDMSLPEED